jgi:hypothetical protein
MDERIGIDRCKDGPKVTIQGKIMPDERSGRTCVREPVRILTDFHHPVAHDTVPPAVRGTVPPENLPAAQGCIKVEELVLVQGDGGHTGSLSHFYPPVLLCCVTIQTCPYRHAGNVSCTTRFLEAPESERIGF